MDLIQALKGRRTIRRFRQEAVPKEELEFIIDMARRAAQAANLQHLRYTVVTAPELAEAIFHRTAWAAYVKPRRTPVWGRTAPPCFIAVTACGAESRFREVDAGAAIQTLLLAAYGRGLGCCWIGAFERDRVSELLELPAGEALLYLVAVGYPDEEPLSEEVAADESIKYYLDDRDRLHVPKIRLQDLIRWR